jgi:hypothetical protein
VASVSFPFSQKVCALVLDQLLTQLPQPTCDAPIGTSKWECTVCKTDSNIMNPQNYPDTQWKDSGAADSLDDFDTWYTTNREKLGAARDVLTMAMASFFEYNADVACADDTSTACSGSVSCQSSDDRSVAAAVVLDGLFNLRAFFVTWRDAMVAEASISQKSVNDFHDAFTSPADESFADQFGQWLVDTVMGYCLGYAFEGLTTKVELSDGQKDVAEQYWDMGQDKLMETIDDNLSSVKETPDMGNITVTMLEFYDEQRKGISNYMSYISDGPDYPDDASANKDELLRQLRVGLWHAGSSASITDIGERAALFMWQYLINYYWANSAFFNPVLIMSDDADDTSNPFSYVAGVDQTVQHPAQGMYLSDEDAASVRFNYNGKTFWLVASVKCQDWAIDTVHSKYCGSPGDGHEAYHFMKPSGVDFLKGKSTDDGG